MSEKNVLILTGLSSVILAFSFGCAPAEITSSSKLDRLMVLGLLAEPAAIQNPVGGFTTVAIDPYLSDLSGQGSIRLSIQSCVDPGVQSGIQKDCSNAENRSLVQEVIVSPQTNAPAGYFGGFERTGKLYTGPIQVPLTIPADFLAKYTSVQRFNGVAYLIWVTARSSEETVHAYRQIFVSTQFPNQNPRATEMIADGSPITALPTKAVEMEVVAAGPESYQMQKADGTVQTQIETLETSWYVSDGTLSSDRTRLGLFTEWTPPSSKPTGRGTLLIGVLRDNRGGVDIITRKF